MFLAAPWLLFLADAFLRFFRLVWGFMGFCACWVLEGLMGSCKGGHSRVL